MISKSSVKVIRLGRMRYGPALKVQDTLVKHILKGEGNSNFLVLVEHEPVYTIGIRRNGYGSDVETKLRKLGADFVMTNRGGLITFHGPGQLVAYPILNLNKISVGIMSQSSSHKQKMLNGMRSYIHTLEQTVIDTLHTHFELSAERSPHTGVWIGDNKICAMGVHNSNLVTSHGLALNCNIDLTWFRHIIPCGILDKGVTSLSQELRREVNIREAEIGFLQEFTRNFDCVLCS